MVKQVPDILFQICRESREVAGKIYSLQLSSSDRHLANTRIDPDNDILCTLRADSPLHPYPYHPSLVTPLTSSDFSHDVLQLRKIAVAFRSSPPEHLLEILRTFKSADQVLILTLYRHDLHDPIIAIRPTKPDQISLLNMLDSSWAASRGNDDEGQRKPVFLVADVAQAGERRKCSVCGCSS